MDDLLLGVVLVVVCFLLSRGFGLLRSLPAKRRQRLLDRKIKAELLHLRKRGRVDPAFSFRDVSERMQALGVSPNDVRRVLDKARKEGVM